MSFFVFIHVCARVRVCVHVSVSLSVALYENLLYVDK